MVERRCDRRKLDGLVFSVELKPRLKNEVITFYANEPSLYRKQTHVEISRRVRVFRGVKIQRTFSPLFNQAWGHP